MPGTQKGCNPFLQRQSAAGPSPAGLAGILALGVRGHPRTTPELCSQVRLRRGVIVPCWQLEHKWLCFLLQFLKVAASRLEKWASLNIAARAACPLSHRIPTADFVIICVLLKMQAGRGAAPCFSYCDQCRKLAFAPRSLQQHRGPRVSQGEGSGVRQKLHFPASPLPQARSRGAYHS